MQLILNNIIMYSLNMSPWTHDDNKFKEKQQTTEAQYKITSRHAPVTFVLTDNNVPHSAWLSLHGQFVFVCGALSK